MRSRLLILLLSLCAGAVLAQEGGEQTRQTVAMSQPVFEGLQQAQELMEGKQYGQGQAVLKQLLAGSDLSPYETAQIWNLSAYAYYLQEDYPSAIRAYSTVLEQAELPEALTQSTLKTLSQLYFTVEDYTRALATVKRLLEVIDDPSPDVLMLEGQAHFQLEHYREALTPIRQAIDKYRAQGKTPQENWLLLLRVCYYELGDFKNMIGVLRELIRLYPKEQYLLTLAGVYSELGDTKKQLALVEALYEDGRIGEPSQLVNLANLYLVHGIPYKAARLLDAELGTGRVASNERHLRLLSQAWYQAREDERALGPLARAAAMAGDGELYVRLAQSYINLDRWNEAADAVKKGLAKGGVSRVDTANVMLGMALFNQRKLEAARKAFAAAATDRRSVDTARQWLAYVDSELAREDTLEQTLPEREKRSTDAILENL
ncbi:MAG: tetratricopeptide repeat protein [Gammaproteobacteria bacterium]